jgi:hypothetical protein
METFICFFTSLVRLDVEAAPRYAYAALRRGRFVRYSGGSPSEEFLVEQRF